MLDEFVIEANTGAAFRELQGNFNVNWTKNIRTVHKKNGCYYSKSMFQFIPFESLEAVEKFETDHDVHLRRCKNCFPDEAEKNR